MFSVIVSNYHITLKIMKDAPVVQKSVNIGKYCRNMGNCQYQQAELDGHVSLLVMIILKCLVIKVSGILSKEKNSENVDDL